MPAGAGRGQGRSVADTAANDCAGCDYARRRCRSGATKRGEERTPLDGRHDVLICGASFAGLAVARELAGSGADVLIVDRYEIGERQTSACGIPTEWLRRAGPDGRRAPALRLAGHAHPPRRRPLPAPLDLLDLRLPRALRAALARLRRRRFETAKVERPRAARRTATARSRSRPTAARSPRRSSSTRSAGAACSPAATATSRPTRRSRAGSRSTRAAAARTSRSGSTAATSPPATAGPSRPATSCGSASAPSTPASTSATRPCCWPRTSARSANAYQGNWIPHKLRRGDRGRRLLRRRLGRPLPAAQRRGDPHRALLRDRPRPRAARRRRGPPEPRAGRRRATPSSTTRTSGSSAGCCACSKLIPRIPPRLLGPLIRLMGSEALRRLVLRPLPADRAAGVRARLSGRSGRCRPAAGRRRPGARG